MPYPTFSSKSSTYHSVELTHNAHTSSEQSLDRTTTQSPQQDDRRSSASRAQDIVWNAFLLTFPLLVLTCGLFALIFAYRVDLSFRSSSLANSATRNTTDLPDKGAYYVDLSSTTLIFVASWMSSLAPLLTGFAITLAAYPVAETLLEDSDKGARERLLTPFQLHLALRLLDGATWGSIWNLLLYRLGWGKHVKSQGAALTSLFSVTSVVLFLR